MSAEPASRRYTLVAIILHWVMALGIAVLAVMGLVMVHANLSSMRQFQLYQLHKSIGITVLLAAVLRLLWRLTHRPPELPDAMPKIERTAASGSHLMLYIYLLALPFTGWALVSSSVFDIPTVLYGVVPWPDLPVLPTLADKAQVENVLKVVHAYGAYTLIALVALHAAAALRHHFIIKDDVLRRMLPAFARRRRTASESAFLKEPIS
jgi:cytochrome b561